MKSNRKNNKPLPIRMLLILLILIAISVIIMQIQQGFSLGIPNPFVRTETTAASSLVLEQVRNISRLNTIEFIYKTVFPHDLIDSGIDPVNLISKYKNHEKLSSRELEMLSLYGIASEAGIDLNGNSFAVVTVRIKAGFDFSEQLPDDAIVTDSVSNSITIKLPPVKITEIIVEDADSSIYKYPDLDVSPEQWKTLTSILSKAVKTEAEKRGILKNAEKRGQDLIRQLLIGAGYTDIVFI